MKDRQAQKVKPTPERDMYAFLHLLNTCSANQREFVLTSRLDGSFHVRIAGPTETLVEAETMPEVVVKAIREAGLK